MPHVQSYDNYPLAPPNISREAALTTEHINHAALEIDASQPLYDARDIGVEDDVRSRFTVVGEIELPIERSAPAGNLAEAARAAIIKATHRDDGRTAFILAGLKPDKQGMRATGTFLSIHAAHGVALGRSNPQAAASIWGEGVRFGDEVSREHLALTVSSPDKLLLADTSSNGTNVSARRVSESIGGTAEHPIYASHVAEHTERNIAKLLRRGHINEQGKAGGRSIITRDTTVGPKGEATLDIRSWAGGGEAIVVDPTKNEQYYAPLKQRFERHVTEAATWAERLTEYEVVRAIYLAVTESMDYDLAAVNAFSERVLALQGPNSLRKVNLGAYLQPDPDTGKGIGVCRHMALAAAWLGSEAAATGLLRGRVTAEVNQRRHDNAAHEWARYTDENGDVTIIDPAQQYFGPLAGMGQRANRWEYFRDSERALYSGKGVGAMAVQQMIHDK